MQCDSIKKKMAASSRLQVSMLPIQRWWQQGHWSINGTKKQIWKSELWQMLLASATAQICFEMFSWLTMPPPIKKRIWAVADAASICHSSNLFRMFSWLTMPPPIKKRIWAVADAASICHSSNLFRNVFVTHDSPPPIKKRIWAVADAASICHSSNLFRNVFFITVTVITICHSSNLLRNVFFTTHWLTHWHPRGHVMPCRAVGRAIEIRPGGCSCISELIHESVPSDSAFQPAASHFKKVQNCFCLDQDLPLGTSSNLCRLAQLASCSCSGSGRRRRTERKEMMDWAYWNGLGCPLASNSSATSWVNNINFWSKRWFSAAFKVGSGSGVSSAGGSSAEGGSPGRCSEVGEVSGGQDHPSPKKAHFPIDQLDNYHALRSGQSVPRCRSSDAYCMHPQAQSMVAAGQGPSSQCWLQWSREVGQ